uniref:Isochorismatase domain-containing protein n=1 Tax=Heterorhabditis bacteriophora TaxID=37862 RepID=A0A1I7WLD2_HETBA
MIFPRNASLYLKKRGAICLVMNVEDVLSGDPVENTGPDLEDCKETLNAANHM